MKQKGFLDYEIATKLVNKSFVENGPSFNLNLDAKLYIPSTLNIDLTLWHTQLIVCAVKF